MANFTPEELRNQFRQQAPTPNLIEEESFVLEQAPSLPFVPLSESNSQRLRREFREGQQDPIESFRNTVNSNNLYDTNKKYTLDYLENNEEYNRVATDFLRSVGSDDNIFEYLRDSDWSTSAALMRGFQSKDWDEEKQQQYRFLKDTFDNAEIGSFRQKAGMVKDIAADMILDPLNLFTIAAGAVTGGLGSVAIRAAATGATRASQIAANQSFRLGAKKLNALANNKTQRALSMAFTEGAADASVLNAGTQLTDMHTGLRTNQKDSIDKLEVIGMGALGGAAGLTFGGAGLFAANHIAKRSLDNLSKETGISKLELGKASTEEISSLKNTINIINDSKFNPLTILVKKPTSNFQEFVDASPTLQNLLTNFRYDAGQSMLSDVTEQVASSYGLASQRKSMDFYYTIVGNLNTLDRTYRRTSDNAFELLPTKRISHEDNIDLVYLTIADKNRGRIKSGITNPLRNNEVIPDEVISVALKNKRALRRMANEADKIRLAGGDLRNVQGDLVENISLFGTSKPITDYFPRFWNNLKDTLIPDTSGYRSSPVAIAKKQKTRTELKQLLVDYGLADPINTKKEIELETGLMGVAKGQLTVDQSAFPRALKEGETFEMLAKRELGDSATEDEIFTKARQLKAEALINNMELKANGALSIGEEAIGTTTPLQERVWGAIPDIELIKLGLVNIEYEDILKQYTMDLGTSIERTRLLGKDLTQFESRWYRPIRKELKEAGFSQEKINKLLNTSTTASNQGSLQRLFETTTGLRTAAEFGKTGMAGAASDTIRTIQQMSSLGLATISSLTEPLIILSRADFADTDAIIKGYSKAAGKQMKRSIGTIFENMQLVRGKKVKGIAKYKDEEWFEALKTGVAIEQGVANRLESMYGEMNTPIAKAASNLFFRINLLQPWTEAVQFAAYDIGKSRSIRLATDLAEGQSRFGVTLSAKDITRRQQELMEIGLNPDQAVKSIKSNKARNNGEFDLDSYMDTPYYQNQVVPAGHLFSNEIILNPSAASATKPLWFNSTAGQIIMQFASYPTAFTNTVLKNMSRKLIKDPKVNAPKILATALLMTETAKFTNAIRTEGESLKEPMSTQNIKALSRWGGLGFFETAYRINEGMDYAPGPLQATGKALIGPTGGDILDWYRYGRNPKEVLVNEIPFYNTFLFPESTRRNMDRWAKGPVKRTAYAVGGEVEGTEVNSPELGEEYLVITMQEHEHQVQDSTKIEVTDLSMIPSLENTSNYYTGLVGNTKTDMTNAFRHSNNIGLKVDESISDVTNPVKIKGKVLFSNVLDLDVDDITPETVLDTLENYPEDKFYDNEFATELLKETKYQLRYRDQVLESDQFRSPERNDVIRKSKNFVVRNALIKLGFDALKTDTGYILLREYQFLPTQIMSRTNRTGKLKRRLKTSIGGIVEGVKVPRTKEDPAEARNPLTGQPYQETKGLLASLRRLKNPERRMRRQEGGELRIDGTEKSMHGYLGPIENSRGQIMTELSIGVEMDGKEILIPTLVPTLNDQDIQVLQNLSEDAPIPESIIKKAVAHAHERMKENKNAFYQHGEEEERANFDEGGLILNKIRELKGDQGDQVAKALKEHGIFVAEIESNNRPDRKQMSGGPGRGKYQYEMSSESKPGQQGAKTAVNRYIRFLEDNNLTLTEEDIALKNDPNPDFSQLSEQMQDNIFYADKYYHPDLILDDLGSGDLSQRAAWLDYHWAGAADDRDSKISMWNDRFPQYVEEEDRANFQKGGEAYNSDRAMKHIRDREGTLDYIYKDSRGLWTSGTGHLLTDEDKARYNITDNVGTREIRTRYGKRTVALNSKGKEIRIDQSEINKNLINDTAKAYEAAKKQAVEMGLPENHRFVEELLGVNFQLGTGWNTIHKQTWAKLLAGQYEDAAIEAADSTWYDQTPARVEDFQKGIRRLGN